MIEISKREHMPYIGSHEDQTDRPYVATNLKSVHLPFLLLGKREKAGSFSRLELKVGAFSFSQLHLLSKVKSPDRVFSYQDVFGEKVRKV